MKACPNCTAPESDTSGNRTHYACGSYSYGDGVTLAHQSDLCAHSEEVAWLRGELTKVCEMTKTKADEMSGEYAKRLVERVQETTARALAE